MPALSYLARAPRRPRTLFVLTPLIDVMFLLLIFFMLSSQIAPYSLLPTERVERGALAQPAAGAESAATSLALRVGAGRVRVGGETRPFSDLVPLLQKLVAQGFTGVVVTAGSDATVQDVVSTLEALEAAGVGNITLLDAAGAS